MNSFDFIPLISIGNVFFGEDRRDVRKKLGEFHEYKKSKFAKATTDDFGFCHVYYDVQNKCDAIEFVVSKSDVIWNGKNLSILNYKDFEKLVEEHDCEINIDDSGFISKKIQMGVYAPNRENVESILVARDGYYE